MHVFDVHFWCNCFTTEIKSFSINVFFLSRQFSVLCATQFQHFVIHEQKTEFQKSKKKIQKLNNLLFDHFETSSNKLNFEKWLKSMNKFNFKELSCETLTTLLIFVVSFKSFCQILSSSSMMLNWKLFIVKNIIVWNLMTNSMFRKMLVLYICWIHFFFEWTLFSNKIFCQCSDMFSLTKSVRKQKRRFVNCFSNKKANCIIRWCVKKMIKDH